MHRVLSRKTLELALALSDYSQLNFNYSKHFLRLLHLIFFNNAREKNKFPSNVWYVLILTEAKVARRVGVYTRFSLSLPVFPERQACRCWSIGSIEGENARDDTSHSFSRLTRETKQSKSNYLQTSAIASARSPEDVFGGRNRNLSSSFNFLMRCTFYTCFLLCFNPRVKALQNLLPFHLPSQLQLRTANQAKHAENFLSRWKYHCSGKW